MNSRLAAPHGRFALAALVALALPATASAQATAYAPPAPRFADVRLPTGVRLRYAEQGNPGGDPVILLHGYTDSWFSYSRVLPLLPASYHAYALDLRGHGDSDRPAAGYTMRDFAADVIAFMDAKGVSRATIVGHSMGGFVAQQVALAAPTRVARLVLVGSVTDARRIDGILDLKRAVDALVDPVPASFARDFQVSTIHRPVPPAFMDRAVAESLKLPAHVWRASMAGMLATEPALRLGANHIPTLILWGDRDAIASRAEQQALASIIGTAVVKVYPETGHAPHWERPDEFARDLGEFISPTPER